MKVILFAAFVLIAGCGATTKPCTDELKVCGQKVMVCASQAGCDLSACVSTGVIQPTPAQ